MMTFSWPLCVNKHFLVADIVTALAKCPTIKLFITEFQLIIARLFLALCNDETHYKGGVVALNLKIWLHGIIPATGQHCDDYFTSDGDLTF
jgi:hypothetical protein